MTTEQSDFADALERNIESKFGKLILKEIDKIAADYQASITEMFKIERVLQSSIELSHLFTDEIYSSVILSDDLLIQLSKDDVFLMTLVLKDDSWHVIYMSPPYYEG